MSRHIRPRLVFVGSFKAAARDGSVGGTMAARRRLMASPFAEAFEIETIDSTSPLVPPPPLAARALTAFGRVTRLCWILTVRRPDVALLFATDGGSFLEKGLMVILCRLRGVPAVLSPRSQKFVAYVSSRRWLLRYGKLVFDSCAAIMAQSQLAQEGLRQAADIPEGKFRVIRNWIDPGERPVSMREGSDDRVVILYLGWLVRHKGIADLVTSIETYAESWRRHRVTFVICGRGSAESEVRQRVNGSGVRDPVSLRGWVTGGDKERVLASADIVVLPSLTEGMPNTLLEAMAAGKACVATRVGGVPEVIVNEGVGRLVEAGDPAALHDALLELVMAPGERARIGAAARAHIERHHDVTESWKSVAELLMSAMRERSGRLERNVGNQPPSAKL